MIATATAIGGCSQVPVRVGKTAPATLPMLMDQSVRGPPWCCSLPLGMRALARVRRHLAPASVCVAPVCGSTSRVLAAGWAHTARPSCAAIQCMQTDWPACGTGGRRSGGPYLARQPHSCARLTVSAAPASVLQGPGSLRRQRQRPRPGQEEKSQPGKGQAPQPQQGQEARQPEPPATEEGEGEWVCARARAGSATAHVSPEHIPA